MPHIKIKVRYLASRLCGFTRERPSLVVLDSQQVSVRYRQRKQSQIILSVERLINTSVVHNGHQDDQNMNTNVNKFISVYPRCNNRVLENLQITSANNRSAGWIR